MATQPSEYLMLGRHEHSLDEKGRVVVPVNFREDLGEKFMVSIGSAKQVCVYPMPIWNEMLRLVRSTDPREELDKDLSFLRRMFGNSDTGNIDPQNRLTIPRYLRDWAGLEEGSPVIIIGSINHLELWSRDNWRDYSERFTEDNVKAAIATRPATPAAPAANDGDSQGESVPNASA